MRLGIVGGSFDPIHIGHLIIGEFALDRKELDKVIYIPTGTAPHKVYELSGSERLKMVELAIEGNDSFEVSNIEVMTENVSYTIDTLKYIKNKYEAEDLYFIIGTDNLWDLEKWYKIEEFYKYAKILLTNRKTGYKSSTDIQEKIDELYKKYNLTIEAIESPFIGISSTMIREFIKTDKSINYLTSKKVVKYIGFKGFYK